MVAHLRYHKCVRTLTLNVLTLGVPPISLGANVRHSKSASS